MSGSVERLGVPRIASSPKGRLSDDTKAKCVKLMSRYPEAASALLPMLYLVQAEHGFVSREGIRELADMLEMSPAEVTAVATFYTMFKREPCGRWLLSVCTQPPCALRGANEIKKALEEELSLTCGQTTADGMIAIEEVECLCICDGAPVVAINYENYEGLNAEQVLEIVRALRSGADPPAPKTGEVPKPWGQAHEELSGLHGVRE